MVGLIGQTCFLHADRPIASIAFHAQGEFLAVASGHKVRNLDISIELIFLLDAL